MMEKTLYDTKKAWYDNEMLVDVLIFLLFPLGIYALMRTDKLRSGPAKIFYGLTGAVAFFGVLAGIFGT